ncbi:unnamed protein product [Plutella xylostella]|uniref:Mediator of RNA polymerase II transcription subunit 15 n=1 Tax=Plutella xylostella TaxID=51655 RepID=A0A8S4F003_PLUXY|nr:unnamed protein product [Plutella xylostella]
MDNLKQFNTMGQEDNWRTQTFRQNVVTKIEEAIQRSGMQVARNSSEMENHVFKKAKTREEYMNMVAKLILHVRDYNGNDKWTMPEFSPSPPHVPVDIKLEQSEEEESCEPSKKKKRIEEIDREETQTKQNQGAPNMQGPNQNQPGQSPQVQQQQQQQGPGQPGMAPDPINALQNLASQGSRNQMMNMGPQQTQMQQQMGPNPNMQMQGQMQQGQMSNQGPQAQTATNLLQTLTQRPPLNMQHKMGPMGMVPNQGQMGNNMMGMGNPMGNQLQGQLGPGMQGQMMPSMAMGNQGMQVPMGQQGMGQMQCGQVGGLGGQMQQQGMQGQMPGQMGMGGNQMVSMGMLQHMGRVGGKEAGGMLGAGYSRAPPPGQFLRQSPSPSAMSPMQGPSPASMGVMGGPMQSPLPLGPMGGCAGVGSPSPSAPPHMQHHPQQQQRGVTMNMVASPSSSLNTPVGGQGSPGGEEAAYRDKVRQLSKYIEPA